MDFMVLMLSCLTLLISILVSSRSKVFSDNYSESRLEIGILTKELEEFDKVEGLESLDSDPSIEDLELEAKITIGLIREQKGEEMSVADENERLVRALGLIDEAAKAEDLEKIKLILNILIGPVEDEDEGE